jgi:hypothetical protein
MCQGCTVPLQVRSIKALKSLGSGFGIVSVGSVQYIRSVPGELNMDNNRVLEVAQVGLVLAAPASQRSTCSSAATPELLPAVGMYTHTQCVIQQVQLASEITNATDVSLIPRLAAAQGLHQCL